MISILIWVVCAVIIMSIQLGMMYLNVRLHDSLFYSLVIFLVVMNMITIYILIRKKRMVYTSDLSGIEIVHN